MPPAGDVDKVIITFLFSLLLLVSPLVEYWAADDSPWYLPYVLWAGIIAAGAWVNRSLRTDDL